MAVTGAPIGIRHSEGLTAGFQRRRIRIFDYTKRAQPLRDEVRVHAKRLAQARGAEIQHARGRQISKENIVAEPVNRRVGAMAFRKGGAAGRLSNGRRRRRSAGFTIGARA